MDEDEAFLYGDDEVTTEPKNGITQSSSEAPPPVFKSTFEAVSRISATPELSEKPLAVETTSIPPLPTPIADIEQNVPNPFLNPAKSTEDITSDLESNGELEVNQEPDEDDDQEVEEEDSDDDLHIILEGDGTHLHSAPNARASVSTSRPEIPRESPAQPRAIDSTNATTEYKILERIEGKPAEPSTPGPAKPAPSLSHNSYRNPYELPTHNRLPTPENFPRPATPPHDSSLGDQQPPINSEAPVPLTGYDDKDGTTLMNFDFDAIPESEKGWKKPGAHVADWFNYGFDETTWRWYVMKQKRHRADESWAANPFAAFATGNIQEAWDTLPSELKGIMMQTIMGPNAGTNGNHGPPMPPPPMPQMMVMNPMMQGMDMGGFGMQGMQGMPGMMGNGHMNGTHHNAGMNNQHNEGPSRGVKQDPAGVSEAGGETPGHYADGMDPREQQHHHHEQQRMQDQMRHMQHMQNMGIGPGFMPGMDLAAMFGNQEMYMNPGQFNGMMEMPQMPQMPQMQHMNSQMQQQMGGGSGMNMAMSQGMSSGVTAGPMNAGIVPNMSQPPTITSPAVPTSAHAPASAPPSVSSVSASAPGPAPGPTPGPVPGPAATPAGLVSTPVGSPGSSMNIQSPLAAGRGRGRGGRGRGNPPASAFLAAAAARGRGRVLSSNGPGAALPSTVPPVTTPIVTPPQINSVPDTVSTPNAVPAAEPSPERSTRAISPLPSNVPTGPRKAALPNPAPARPIRVTPVGYFDKDAAGARGDEGLDYGGGSAESPHEERKMSLPISRRHGNRNDREKLEEDPRERPENYSERSRSKSRDKEPDEKDSTSGLHRKSRHHHRGRSRSKESDHRSSREKSEKDKEEGSNHKSGRGSGGSRRSRRSKRTTETDEKEDARDGPSDDRDKDRDKEKGRERGRDKDKERERDREKEKEREKQKERDRDRDKDGDKDKGKDEMKDKEHDKDKERERDDGTDAGAEHGTSGSSRKRKSTKEDRGSRSSKRERAE